VTQTEDVVHLIRSVLGTDVVGAYLHGSAVLGGLRPHSDLDVLVVAGRQLTATERRALGEGLLAISGVYPRRGTALPVELTVVVQSDVRPWRYPPRCELLYGEWLRDAFVRGGPPAPGPSPDLAPLLTMVHLGNTPLVGPPPGEVLDPVPPEDLRRALVAGVPDLLADLEGDTRNVVLTLARIWTTLATGAIRSKDAAAAWALPHLPAEHRPVLARARAIYLGDEEEHWDDLRPHVRPHVAHVVGVIERLATRGG
jgi:streptomycin 3"-adenylyltransferase